MASHNDVSKHYNNVQRGKQFSFVDYREIKIIAINQFGWQKANAHLYKESQPQFRASYRFTKVFD